MTVAYLRNAVRVPTMLVPRKPAAPHPNSGLAWSAAPALDGNAIVILILGCVPSFGGGGRDTRSPEVVGHVCTAYGCLSLIVTSIT